MYFINILFVFCNVLFYRADKSFFNLFFWVIKIFTLRNFIFFLAVTKYPECTVFKNLWILKSFSCFLLSLNWSVCLWQWKVFIFFSWNLKFTRSFFNEQKHFENFQNGQFFFVTSKESCWKMSENSQETWSLRKFLELKLFGI